MDDIMSMVDGWGPDFPDPIKLATLPSDRLSQLSLLIGGVGDGNWFKITIYIYLLIFCMQVAMH